jgi:hypothetical protein
MHAPQAKPKAKAKAAPKLTAEGWLTFLLLLYGQFEALGPKGRLIFLLLIYGRFYRARVYRDSRFKNSLGRPQPSKRDKNGKPRGYIPPTDERKFDPWAKTWDKPLFDKWCMFVPAVCEGALCGGDVSARVARKIGTAKEYKQLLAAAETTPAMRVVRGKFNHSLYFRWPLARASYVDIRKVGKIRCAPDITHMQAAARDIEWGLCCTLDRTPRSLKIRGPLANGDYTAGKILPFPDSGPPPQHVLRELPSVKEIKEAAQKIDQGCDDTELALSMALRCVMRERWPQAPLTIRARNRLISDNLWVARAVAQKHRGEDGEAIADDLGQEAVFGLDKAVHDFDPTAGSKLSSFAWTRVEWWIRDHLDKSRELRRHGSVDAIAASGSEEMLGRYASSSRDPDEEKYFD